MDLPRQQQVKKRIQEHGIGLSAAFGKEWWVSSNWGIGAALQLHAASMKDRGVDTRTTGFDLALLVHPFAASPIAITSNWDCVPVQHLRLSDISPT